MSRKQTKPLKINYYISGHGFGHATRSAQIVQALLCADPRTQITVITTAPQHLFTPSDRLKFIWRAVDSAIVQPQPYTIDAVVSFRNLQTFLQATDNEQWHAEASSLLELSDCNMIIADAPCPIIWNCNKSIKSVLISNFSFDAIFEELVQYLPLADQTGNKALVTKLCQLYASYSHVIRLPGFIDLPFVDHHWTVQQKQDNVFDSPLVFRQARKSKKEVLSMLGVAKEDHDRKKILLVQFGGQIVGGSSERRPQLPKDWICLNASAVPGDSNFVTFPPDVYSPDLIEAADVVLGKIGYGTVSECVGMNKALIYVLRPMFAEESGLLQYMQENGTCAEISVKDYESGRWAEIIESVHEKHCSIRSRRSPVVEGSVRVADIVQQIAARSV